MSQIEKERASQVENYQYNDLMKILMDKFQNLEVKLNKNLSNIIKIDVEA